MRNQHLVSKAALARAVLAELEAKQKKRLREVGLEAQALAPLNLVRPVPVVVQVRHTPTASITLDAETSGFLGFIDYSGAVTANNAAEVRARILMPLFSSAHIGTTALVQTL